MQLSEMRNFVRNVVDIDSTDVSDTTMDSFIREGYNAVVYSEKRWPFYEVATTFATEADKKDYTLTDVGENIKVTHDGVEFAGTSVPKTPGMRDIASLKTDSHVLEFIGYDDADTVYPLNSNTQSDPWYWSFWGDQVRLYPTPGAATTIYVRGYRNAIDFGGLASTTRSAIADADTPDWPDPFDNVLSLYVIFRTYQQQEDAGMGQQYYAGFLSELDNLKARYEGAPAPQPILLNSRIASRWRSQMFLPGRLRYSWE